MKKMQKLNFKDIFLIIHITIGIIYLFTVRQTIQKVLDVMLIIEFAIILVYMLILHLRKDDQKIRRTLGLWCLVFPICIGANCFVYSFVDLPYTLFMIEALLVFLITVLIWKCGLIKGLLPILLVIVAIGLGIGGTVVEVNGLQTLETQVKDVTIVEKEKETGGRLMENLYPSYYFTVEDETGIKYEEISISKKTYDKYKENDQTLLCTEKGTLGLTYWYIDELSYISLFD